MRKSSARPRQFLNCRGASYLLAAALCAASPAARAANGGEPYPVERTTAPVAAIVSVRQDFPWSNDVEILYSISGCPPGGIVGVFEGHVTAGHNAFLAGAATAASPGGDGVWADTLAVADGAVLAYEAEAADGKRLHEFLNLDDESFDWVKSTAAEGVPAGYPVPAWYDSASH